MAEKHQDDTLNAEVERTPKADQEKNERSEVYNANFESQVLPSMMDDSNSSSDTEHETSAGDILNYHAKGMLLVVNFGTNCLLSKVVGEELNEFR